VCGILIRSPRVFFLPASATVPAVMEVDLIPSAPRQTARASDDGTAFGLSSPIERAVQRFRAGVHLGILIP
jgi:hypothetical protein